MIFCLIIFYRSKLCAQVENRKGGSVEVAKVYNKITKVKCIIPNSNV